MTVCVGVFDQVSNTPFSDRRITKEHGGLLAGLTGKPDVRRQHKRNPLRGELICQRLPIIHLQNRTQVGHGHQMLGHMAGVGGGKGFAQVQRNLVTKKVKVDPGVGAAPFAAAQHAAVELARGIQIAHMKSQVKQGLHGVSRFVD